MTKNKKQSAETNPIYIKKAIEKIREEGFIYEISPGIYTPIRYINFNTGLIWLDETAYYISEFLKLKGINE